MGYFMTAEHDISDDDSLSGRNAHQIVATEPAPDSPDKKVEWREVPFR